MIEEIPPSRSLRNRVPPRTLNRFTYGEPVGRNPPATDGPVPLTGPTAATHRELTRAFAPQPDDQPDERRPSQEGAGRVSDAARPPPPPRHKKHNHKNTPPPTKRKAEKKQENPPPHPPTP